MFIPWYFSDYDNYAPFILDNGCKNSAKKPAGFFENTPTGFSHLTEGRVLDVTSLRLASKGCVDPVSNAVCESVFLHRSPDGLMAFLVKRRWSSKKSLEKNTKMDDIQGGGKKTLVTKVIFLNQDPEGS